MNTRSILFAAAPALLRFGALLFLGIAGASSAHAANYPSIAGTYTATNTVRAVTSMNGGAGTTENFTGDDPSATIVQTGNRFSCTVIDPYCKSKRTISGRLTGNSIVMDDGPITNFTAAEGTTMTKNAITSSSGTVSQGRITVHMVGVVQGGGSGVTYSVAITSDIVLTGTVSPVAAITSQPVSQSAAVGGTVTLATAATGPATFTYKWYKDGLPITGATSASLALPNVGSADAGIYDVVVSDSALSKPTVVGVLPAAGVRTTGSVTTKPEWQDIRHPNGNIYDQFLLSGPAGTFTAGSGKIARMSYIDANNSIVQVEMSGAGAISIVLQNASGPAAPTAYNQPTVQYMKGDATIIVAGADETTNLTIYSVGSLSSPGIVRGDVTYAGWARVTALGIVSTNGKLGAIRMGNAGLGASHGFAGVCAPTVDTVVGPVVIHDIAASSDALPYLYFAPTAQVNVRIAGGNLAQANGESLSVAGVAQVLMAGGQQSTGTIVSGSANQAKLVTDDGTDVTAQLVVGP